MKGLENCSKIKKQGEGRLFGTQEYMTSKKLNQCFSFITNYGPISKMLETLHMISVKTWCLAQPRTDHGK